MTELAGLKIPAFSMASMKDHHLKVFLELPRMHKEEQEWFDSGIIYAFSFSYLSTEKSQFQWTDQRMSKESDD